MQVLAGKIETVKTAAIGVLVGVIGGAVISMHMGLTTWQSASARYGNVSVYSTGPTDTPAPSAAPK